MTIRILGAESLGVRGLCCSVELKNRKIVIDPGIALGWSRYGLKPHPFQVAVGAAVREQIVEELKDAGDVVFSHFHGDHCPLDDPNPYQLGMEQVQPALRSCRVWAKGPDSTPIQRRRREGLAEAISRDLRNTEGLKKGPLAFSRPVPHGQPRAQENKVMMTRIEENGETFVHASDVQLLEEKTIEAILDWKPDVVLASGPPMYRYSSSSYHSLGQKAWQNTMRLSKGVDTVIIDHHLLRSEQGIRWLRKLQRTSPHSVYCAADFMKREPLFLEAWRKELYGWLPVDQDWHEEYRQGRADFDEYRSRGWEVLMSSGRIHPCKWYSCCPIKQYTDAGKLERYWIENYCLVGNKSCLRYQMEERHEHHPDNILPNGEIREDLR